MAHYVYGLFTKDSNRLFYIGISSGSKNLYHRQKNHMTESSNLRKMNMINKHGMCMKIIWKVKTRIDAEQREYIGLQKRELEKILCSINNTGRPKEIIFKISEMTGFSINRSKKIYYDRYLPRFTEEI